MCWNRKNSAAGVVLLKYAVPYGESYAEFDTRGRTPIFAGEGTSVPAVADFRKALLKALDEPIASPSLADLASGKKDILFLVEDNTRGTPLDKMLPIVTEYLISSGVHADAISFMTAPGTHRLMTDEELRVKLGDYIMDNFTVMQHDARRTEALVDLGEITAGGVAIPVHVNRRALEADLLVGTGSIVPHSDAGYSGGAKIVQPGICGFVTTQATHRAAGLCPDVPLGLLEGNPCRMGIDAVGKLVGLAFIINVVKNFSGDVAGFFCGDFMKAHRAGVELSRRAYSVEINRTADIVVASSYPADADYWQGIKGLTSAYFAVSRGGAIVLASPCSEGLVHNHPLYAHWLASPVHDIERAIKAASPYDLTTDVIAATVALGSRRVLARADVYMVTDGLSDECVRSMGYIPARSVQDAYDMALESRPDAEVGILPQGGVSLPVLKQK